MGGSGGGYFRGKGDLSSFTRMIKDSEAQSRDDAYETSVNQALGDLLKDFNSRDVSGTKEILDDIKKELSDVIGETVDLTFGGSVSKHTYLEGLSDTDALVILNPDKSESVFPKLLKNRFAKRLGEVYGSENVRTGKLAVTVTVRGKEIQLLPAIQLKGSLRIPSPNGQIWSRINPKGFACKLTQANKNQDGKLIPCIKLAKAMIVFLPKKQQLKGYHIESLAIEAFKRYDGPKTYKAMTTHFFEKAPELVKSPIKDKTGQSLYVDEYLGKEKSNERRIVSHALKRLHRKIVNADAAGNPDAWTELVSPK